MYLRLVIASLAVLVGARGANGVVAYWDADRACSGWRDGEWMKGGSGRMHFDPKVKRHGVAAVRLEGVPDREIHVSSVCAVIPVKAEGTYVLRFWSRRAGEDGQASCQILAHRMAGERHSKPIGWVRIGGKDRLPLPVRDQWQLHEVTLGALPGGTARLYFYFRLKGKTTLWVDEFSLAEEGVKVELGGQPALTDADYAGIRFEDDHLPENLLKNGGFEEGTKHWQSMGPKIACAVDGTRAAAGKGSLRISGKEFTAGGMFQRVGIDPRRRYRLSVRADGKELVGYFFTKVLGFDRQNHPRGWLGGEALYCARDGDWAERSVEFTPRPSTDNVVIYLRVEDTIGDVWVDEVRLVPLPMVEQGGGK
ncbi:MAG: hypothetical protein HN849_14590 [Victivallales bacterium]|nr:hypothetical protein [Victivallales bacterium]